MTMSVQITCNECKSSIEVLPSLAANKVECDVCKNVMDVHFKPHHMENKICECVVCERKDFYRQKDFNRTVGVTLFVIASILSIWTYGISFIVLYAADFWLFRKLHSVVVCYKCLTVYRNAQNISDIAFYDHEMNDRIVYADHQFDGKPIHH